MNRSAEVIPRILKHEGGFINHPKDPGGATNRGVTIGTLKRLGIDKDGEGDSDIVDLRQITESDAVRVYKRFYWDAVQGDLLPAGLDYAVADYAVNSGPARATKALQKIIGVEVDGQFGPKTFAALAGLDPSALINALCSERLAFMRRLDTWPTFKGGWQRRVDEVRSMALADTLVPQVVARPITSKPVDDRNNSNPIAKPGFWAAIILAICSPHARG